MSAVVQMQAMFIEPVFQHPCSSVSLFAAKLNSTSLMGFCQIYCRVKCLTSGSAYLVGYFLG